MKEDEMGGAYGTGGRGEKFFRILVGKPKERGLSSRSVVI
jgi:hypothetical protein